MRDRIVTGRDRAVRSVVAITVALAFVLVSAAPANAQPAPTRWAVLVGIDVYADPGISPLTGAVQDVTAIREALVTRARFPSEQVFLLTSGDPANSPTTGNIQARLDHVARRAGAEDLVYVHFAMHGTADAETGEGFLWTYRMDPRRYREEGLALADVRARLSGMQARRKIVVLDACRNDPNAGRGSGDNPMSQAISRGVKGVVQEAAAPRAAGFEAVFFGCAVGERAYEWPGKDRGLFSVALEDALRGAGEGDGDGQVTLAELCSYVTGRMADLMSLVAPGKRQTPQVEPPPGAGGYVVSWGREQPTGSGTLPPVRPVSQGPVEELPPVVAGGKPPTIEIEPADRERLSQPLDKMQSRRVVIRYLGLDDRAVKLYRWRLDDGPIQETKRGLADIPVPGVPAPGPGTHTFQVQVQDVEGNWSSAARVAFQVLSNQRPEVAFTEPTEGQAVTGKALRVRLSGTDPDGRVASWRCALDDPDSFETKDAPAFEFADPVDGSHTLYAQSVDEDGALSLWMSRRIVFRYEDPTRAQTQQGADIVATDSAGHPTSTAILSDWGFALRYGLGNPGGDLDRRFGHFHARDLFRAELRRRLSDWCYLDFAWERAGFSGSTMYGAGGKLSISSPSVGLMVCTPSTEPSFAHLVFGVGTNKYDGDLERDYFDNTPGVMSDVNEKTELRGSGLGWRFGAGCELALTSRWSVVLEARLLKTKAIATSTSRTPRASWTTDRGEVSVRYDAITVGFVYHW